MNDQTMTPGEKCERGRKGGGEEKRVLTILENYTPWYYWKCISNLCIFLISSNILHSK